jgi:hypothetical protein
MVFSMAASWLPAVMMRCADSDIGDWCLVGADCCIERLVVERVSHPKGHCSTLKLTVRYASAAQCTHPSALRDVTS